MQRPAIALVLASSFAALVACGGGTPPAKTTASAATPAVTTTAAPAAEAAPDHALRRSAVRAAVTGGLGYFLQKVTLDDRPVMNAGRFHGFRVTGLRDARFWQGIDLRPGDVVVSVNGMPIEHPEEALEAFRSLEVASELRVQYERDGKTRELRYAIVDDEPPPQKHADASAP